MEENIKSANCWTCGRPAPESLDAKRDRVLVKAKYKNSRKNSRGASGKRSESLFASEAMFVLAGAMTLLALFYNSYAHAPFAAPGEAFRASSMSPSAVSNMIADNLFILVVPVAALFLVSQTFLLHQIRQNVSYRR